MLLHFHPGLTNGLVDLVELGLIPIILLDIR